MSDSIELFKTQGFIPNDLRPSDITFRPRRARRINRKAVSVYQNANKRITTDSVDSISAKKSMRISKESNPSRRLSMRVDVGKEPSRVSSRLDDGLPTEKQSFLNLKWRLEIQKERNECGH